MFHVNDVTQQMDRRGKLVGWPRSLGPSSTWDLLPGTWPHVGNSKKIKTTHFEGPRGKTRGGSKSRRQTSVVEARGWSLIIVYVDASLCLRP